MRIVIVKGEGEKEKEENPECNGHFHSECMDEYIAEAEKAGGFLCPHCRPNTIQDKQS